ncbi:unnamed protein product [Angiostrongylus costaricensis]|uniref:Uncharacterized protein n=1 Tax=Angiostrongylus costaricensis TaxID=334426 RepID=A0A0R3PWU9_ANGCS|nr:unnamed protein product [Angiostrongylus costaricensis]
MLRYLQDSGPQVSAVGNERAVVLTGEQHSYSIQYRPPLHTKFHFCDNQVWRDRCALEEAARSALVEEIVRLRNDCATLRAKIEHCGQRQMSAPIKSCGDL